MQPQLHRDPVTGAVAPHLLRLQRAALAHGVAPLGRVEVLGGDTALAPAHEPRAHQPPQPLGLALGGAQLGVLLLAPPRLLASARPPPAGRTPPCGLCVAPPPAAPLGPGARRGAPWPRLAPPRPRSAPSACATRRATGWSEGRSVTNCRPCASCTSCSVACTSTAPGASGVSKSRLVAMPGLMHSTGGGALGSAESTRGWGVASQSGGAGRSPHAGRGGEHGGQQRQSGEHGEVTSEGGRRRRVLARRLYHASAPRRAPLRPASPGARTRAPLSRRRWTCRLRPRHAGADSTTRQTGYVLPCSVVAWTKCPQAHFSVRMIRPESTVRRLELPEVVARDHRRPPLVDLDGLPHSPCAR